MTAAANVAGLSKDFHAASKFYVRTALWGRGQRSRGRRRAALNESDAASGIRAALERGAAAAVRCSAARWLSRQSEGAHSAARLSRDAAKVLKFTGQQQRVDELVTAMNRAAEAAVPEAKTLLVNAVRSMSVEDARGILTGGNDSATQFFAAKTRAPLAGGFCRSSRGRPRRSRWPTSTTRSPARRRVSAWFARTTRTCSST